MTLLKGIRDWTASVLDSRIELVAWSVGVLYLGYFVFSLVGVVLMLLNEDQQWTVEFTNIVIYVSSGLHFGFTASSFVLIEDYDHAPVEPVAAFLFADYFQAGALGATITAHALSPSNRTAAYVAAIIAMLAQVLCMYKTLTIVSQTRSGERKKFGRLVA